MLPTQQPAHVLRRGDGLNLLAQGCNCEVMNARQQAPLAPLAVVLSLPHALAGEVSAQNRSRASNRSSACSTSLRASPSQYDSAPAYRPAVHHPASDHRQQSIVARGGVSTASRAASLRTAHQERSAQNPSRVPRRQVAALTDVRCGTPPPCLGEVFARTTRQPSISSAITASSCAIACCQSSSAISSGRATSVCSVSCSSSHRGHRDGPLRAPAQ